MAFVENFIPILNLFRVPAIVRDVVHRLEPGASRGEALILAAWIGLLGGFLVPRILSFFTADIQTLVRISAIGTGLMLVGAIFLVALIWWVEGRILRRRVAQLAEGNATPETPVAQPANEPSVEPDLVSTRSAFAAAGLAAMSDDASPPAPPPASPPPSSVPPVDAEPAAAPPSEPVMAPWPAPEPLVEPMPKPVMAGPGPVDEPTPVPVDEPAPHQVAATLNGPPHLTIRVTPRGMITAEMDGETEHVILDDLGDYGSALAKVDGTAAIVVPTDDTMAGLIARRAQRILENAGVQVTVD
jgi:hypothetical protein